MVLSGNACKEEPRYRIAVQVKPRASCDEVMGLRKDTGGFDLVCVGVKALPEKGKANEAVCRVIARSLGVPKSTVVVVRGASSSHKQLLVTAPKALIARWKSKLLRL